MNSFHDLVIHRRSYRKYTDELLNPEQVRLILEAALMSPAGKRKNPWHFVVVEDNIKIDEVFFNVFNKSWLTFKFCFELNIGQIISSDANSCIEQINN